MKTKLLKNALIYAGFFFATRVVAQVIPTASYSASADTICAGTSIQFTDLSSDAPTVWSYSVNGTAFSTLQNPSISFTVPGTYSIDLEAGNVAGTSAVFSSTVFVNPLPTVSITGNTSLCSGVTDTLFAAGATNYVWSPGTLFGDTLLISPLVSTSYTVVGTNTVTGCSDSSFVQVTVKPLPVLAVNDATICAGESFTLLPTGADSYTYSGGSDVVSPPQTSTYTISGMSAQTGCVDSTVVTIQVNALPNVTANSGVICAGAVFTINPAGASSYTFSGGSNTVSPSTTAMYTVQGLSASNGCVGQATLTVLVIPAPVITVNSGTICAGETFTLMPSGAFTYTLSSGSETVMPTVTTQYTVTGQDSTGCLSTAPAIATVQVSGMIPVVTISASIPGVMCVGDEVILGAFGATNYTWSTGETTPTVVISPTVTTIFTVVGEDVLSGCASGASFIQNVFSCTGLEDFAKEVQVTAFPNPTPDNFILEVDHPVNVQITNALGEVVVNESMPTGKNRVELSGQAGGIYFVRIQQNNSVKIIRVVKQ